jgi:hypothetical protein
VKGDFPDQQTMPTLFWFTTHPADKMQDGERGRRPKEEESIVSAREDGV